MAAAHLYIIYKGLIADPKGNFALDACWVPDSQDDLITYLLIGTQILWVLSKRL